MLSSFFGGSAAPSSTTTTATITSTRTAGEPEGEYSVRLFAQTETEGGLVVKNRDVEDDRPAFRWGGKRYRLCVDDGVKQCVLSVFGAQHDPMQLDIHLAAVINEKQGFLDSSDHAVFTFAGSSTAGNRDWVLARLAAAMPTPMTSRLLDSMQSLLASVDQMLANTEAAGVRFVDAGVFQDVDQPERLLVAHCMYMASRVEKNRVSEMLFGASAPKVSVMVAVKVIGLLPSFVADVSHWPV